MATVDWHDRYTQQARWTADLRRFLFGQAGLEQAGRVLEAGCGTGAVLAALPRPAAGSYFGLDINPEHLARAQESAPGAALTLGDAHQLPYADDSFDIVYCHFLLLWLSNPERALDEMRRVTRPGGWVIALAEPDFGGRIDYPEALAEVGRLQEQALRAQGAEPRLGRRLLGLFSVAGLEQVSAGVMGGQWQASSGEDWRLEWEVLQADLGERLPQGEARRLMQIEKDARSKGERLLFVPTFFATGRKSHK